MALCRSNQGTKGDLLTALQYCNYYHMLIYANTIRLMLISLIYVNILIVFVFIFL